MTLFEETLQLVRNDRGNWVQTAEKTGLKREWIAKLAQGKFDDPGVNKIEILHGHLSKKYPDFVFSGLESDDPLSAENADH